MPQLTRITINIGADLNFRCPYQAKVMNIFETNNNKIGAAYLIMVFIIKQKDFTKNMIFHGKFMEKSR